MKGQLPPLVERPSDRVRLEDTRAGPIWAYGKERLNGQGDLSRVSGIDGDWRCILPISWVDPNRHEAYPVCELHGDAVYFRRHVHPHVYSEVRWPAGVPCVAGIGTLGEIIGRAQVVEVARVCRIIGERRCDSRHRPAL